MKPDIPCLKDWRCRKGIALDAISQSTKLSIRLLEAIERGEFCKLPGGIYNTNYIRQYARAIEFDEGTLLAYYHSSSQADAGVRVGGPLFQT